jgi:nucleotide-binding universal stress UspA family protein
MLPFKKILVPVDFSEPSKKALTYGMTLATQLKAKLLIAHIVPESVAFAYAFPIESYQIEKQQYDTAQREIQALVPPNYGAAFGVQTIVKIGQVEPELLGIVKEEKVDLVVMGTHGRRYVGRWFMGSVTEHILRKVPVPVMTVSHVSPEKHMIDLGLVTARRILYATDLSDSASAGMAYAVELARTADAQLTVLHVADDLDIALWGGAIAGYLEDGRARLVQDLQRKLTEFVTREKPVDMEVEALVLEGKPYERILSFAEDRAMDMIVLNLQSKNRIDRALLGATAERVIRLAHIPVLCVPAALNPKEKEPCALTIS